ncbi:MAG TPA: tetratricopeptide repeat protein [Woeseiaceae bacterium]|nr:tetratricopeptide repeat protein [Woeseiaceae bacterium]
MDQRVPVAGEDAAAEAESRPGPPRRRKADLREELLDEFDNYKRLMSEGTYDEADTVAKRVVTLSIQLTGPRSSETAKALTNLGIVQHRNKQFDAAQQNFAAAIDIIEERNDRLNRRLINPLKGLGAAQLEGGRPDLAEQTFTRAIHITHVNEGPHNLDQIEILESLAETNVRLGSIEEARAMHDMIYQLHRRRFEDDQLALIPSLMRRAEWQHRAGYIADEQATYRRAIRIIETSASKEDFRLIEPLTKLGESYFYTDLHGEQGVYTDPATGEIYFKRALRIAESNPQSDWATATNSKLSLADYYLMQGNFARARKLYAEIWESLSDGEAKLLFRDETFGKAVPLNDRPIPEFASEAGPSPLGRPSEEFLQGSVTVSFSVTDRGRVIEIEPVEVVPGVFTDMEKLVHREIRGRLYRPRFEDAEPVESTNQFFTHLFYYKQSDLEERRETAAGGTET